MGGGRCIVFTDAGNLFFSPNSLVQLLFSFQNFFYSDKEDGVFFCGEMFQS